MNTSYFKELIKHLEGAPGPLEILDIGVGTGRSCVFLAKQGHRVTALEPSLDQCLILDAVANRFGLTIPIVHGPAEAADQIEGKFDLVVFNSSIHHCDDPVRALSHCRALLKPGGTLLLLNEPILKPFRSKKWYQHKLETDPQAMGHYGGNEHVYYAWEYQAMLKQAGLHHVRSYPATSVTDIRGTVFHMTTAKVLGKHVYSEKKLIQHTLWSFFLYTIARVSFLRKLFGRLSLLPLSFAGQA